MTAETMLDQSDRELVERFLARQDEAVFETLVRRHGPMVYRVCWRVLHHSQESEDAFQATFMVLAQKLKTLRNRDSLASWLHGVARRVALKAQAQASARRQHQRRVTASEVLAPDEVTWKELRLVLDAELASLPERLRLPLILCYLEGCAQEDAARQLGWSKSTLIRRLEEARLALGRRLTRRGVSWSAALSAVLLSDCVASAALPSELVGSTAKAAALVLAGGVATSIVSPKVVALTEGVIKAMFTIKVKVLAAMLLLVGATSIWFLGTGGPAVLGQEPKQSNEVAKESPPRPTSEDAKDEPKPAVKPIAVTEKAAINRLAWDAKGETLVTVGWAFEVAEITGPDGQNPQKVLLPNSTIKLRDAKTGEVKKSLGEEKGIAISNLTLSPDRKTAVVTAIKFTNKDGKPSGGSRGTEVMLFDPEKWELKRAVDSDGSDAPLKPLVHAVVFSPDGKTLAMGGSSPRAKGGCFLKLWDIQKEKLIGGTKEANEAEAGGGFPEAVTSLAFSPDGKLLAAGCADGKLRLFDGRTGELKKVWNDDVASAWWIVFSPNGKTLVSQSSDKTVKVWDVETAKVSRTLKGNKASVMSVAFSPDGKLFATGGIVREKDKIIGGEVILWDAETGDLKHTLPGLTVPVSTLSFSPDGKTLAIAGGTSGDLKDGGKTTGEIKLFSLDSLALGEQPKAKEGLPTETTGTETTDEVQKLPPSKDADKPKTDNDRLQGTWEFVSYSHGGKTQKKKDLPNKGGQPVTLTFEGDKTLSANLDAAGKNIVEAKGSFRINAERQPKEIDLMEDDGKSKRTASGIYELNGDTLQLCWPEDPKDKRPTKLEDQTYHLMTYKRVAKKNAEPQGGLKEQSDDARKAVVQMFRQRISKIMDNLEGAKDEKAIQAALKELQATEDGLRALLSRELVLKVYPAGDVVGKDATGVIQLITSTIEPSSWSKRGGKGTIEYYAEGKVLLISQTSDIQLRVEAILTGLRK
jgi:RNA polymerase sigma factor (sigma-70 family)